jgi:hypothetical protein
VTEPVRCRWILIQRRVGVISIGEGGSSPACSREEDIDGEGCRGGRTRRRGAEKIPAALLLHLPAPVLPTAAERGGATRVQELAGGAGYDERERTKGREVVWEVARDGVGSMVCSEGGFYRPERAGAGVSRRWPGRVSGDVQRAKPGAAALGACWRGAVMASGHCGQVVRGLACWTGPR